MRDPIVTKAGEDYYRKTFSTATGRNRWGDYGTRAGRSVRRPLDLVSAGVREGAHRDGR
jgi:hypothetical protein